MWITEYSDDPLLWPKSGKGVCVGEPAPRAGLAHADIVPKNQTPCTGTKPKENRLRIVVALSFLPTLFREEPKSCCIINLARYPSLNTPTDSAEEPKFLGI